MFCLKVKKIKLSFQTLSFVQFIVFHFVRMGYVTFEVLSQYFFFWWVFCKGGYSKTSSMTFWEL